MLSIKVSPAVTGITALNGVPDPGPCEFNELPPLGPVLPFSEAELQLT